MEKQEKPSAKRGAKRKDAAKKKVGMTVTLLPHQKTRIEELAQQAEKTPSELIIKKFKL